MLARHAVLTAQAIASLGLAAGSAAGGLLAVAVTGEAATAAAPLGALVLGGGLSASVVGGVMSRVGRLPGLVAGYLGGLVGAALVLGAVATASFGALLVGHLVFGAGNTAVMLSRYVVADLDTSDRRGRAISTSMATITLGAVVGPNLLGRASGVALAVGLPPAAGLYIVASIAFLAAPILLVVSAPSSRPATPPAGAVPSLRDGSRAPRRLPHVGAALAVLTTANVTMVAMMSVVPVQLHADGHGFGRVGAVVSLHIAAMYVASPVLGRLCDRRGPVRLATAGALLFCLTGAVAVVAGNDGIGAVTGLLILLGVAWNVQLVAGSALLTTGVGARQRPRLEGRGELAMSVGAAAGSLLIAGPVAAVGGMALLAVVMVPLHLGVLVLLYARRPEPEPSARAVARVVARAGGVIHVIPRPTSRRTRPRTYSSSD